MAVTDLVSTSIALWGACLSTLLALVKLYELWRDRARVEVSYSFTGDERIGNEVFIRNLSSRPVILTDWELLYCSGHWPRRIFKPLERADFDAGDHRVDSYATYTMRFAEQNYFDWGYQSLSGRRIFVLLHIAGQKPLLKFLYS